MVIMLPAQHLLAFAEALQRLRRAALLDGGRFPRTRKLGHSM